MKHFNTAIIQNVTDFFRPKGEAMSDSVSEEISLVYNVKPNTEVITNTGIYNTQASLMYTTPIDRDFYVQQVQLAYTGFSPATQFAGLSVAIYRSGVQVKIIKLLSIGIAGSPQSLSVTFDKPLKVDRGTEIQLLSDDASYTNGYAIMFGYNL